MRSPFPGMTPFLEQDELWPAVHQTQIHYIYDRGRYHLAIDYNTILQPLLCEADQAWIKTFA